MGKHQPPAHEAQIEHKYVELPGWFWNSLAAINARDDVLIFGFQGETLAERVAERHPDVILIPRYKGNISVADPHPNPTGHEHIAESIAPYIEGHHCP